MSWLIVPDCIFILWMTYVLYQLRDKCDFEIFPLWAKAQLLIVVEVIARVLYKTFPNYPLHQLMHITVLDCYLLAGWVYFQTALGERRNRAFSMLYRTLVFFPCLILLTFYGAEFYSRTLYLGLSVCGTLLSLLAVWRLKRPRKHVLYHLLLWGPVVWFSWHALYRYAAYYSLFAIYALTALGFALTLPRGRKGRVVIIAGFASWALCFLAHPWMKDGAFPLLLPLVGHIWDMEMFVTTFGFLILALEEVSARNEHSALHDELTRLPNRRLFADRAQMAFARARRNQSRVALFSIDLNDFKKINDTWGHEAGDFLLREVATRLKAAVRESDTLCRVGGDEFWLLISDFCPHEREACDLERVLQQAADLARELCGKVLSRACIYDTGSERVPLKASISIGCAIFPDQADSMEEMSRVADKKMYAHKRSRLSLVASKAEAAERLSDRDMAMPQS